MKVLLIILGVYVFARRNCQEDMDVWSLTLSLTAPLSVVQLWG